MHKSGRTRELRNAHDAAVRTQQRMTLSGKPLTLQDEKRSTTVRYVVIHAAYFLFMFFVRLLAAPPEDRISRVRCFSFVPMWQSLKPRKGQKHEGLEMKLFGVMLALGLLGVGIFYMVNEENRKQRQEAYRREEIERQRENERMEKARQEDERIRKERMAALAKEDAVLMLQRYITREEAVLKDTIEECKLKLQSIDIDQKSLSDELTALEKEEAVRAADAKRRNVKRRRDKTARVDALLSSPTLNRLADTYLGEDLAAMRAKFRSHLKSLTQMSDEKTRRYAENKAKFQKAIVDSDAEVTRLTENASRELGKARGQLNVNTAVLRKRVEGYRAEIARLEKKQKLTTLNMNEKKQLKELSTILLPTAEAQLASNEATEGLGTANKAHLDVTMAETKARRTADTALSVRMDDDNAVEAEMNREIAIFNAASQYETMSLDRVRDAMQRSRSAVSYQMSIAEKKLRFLAGSIANLDMLNAEEVEALRKTIAQRLAEDVSFDPDRSSDKKRIEL